MVSFCNFRFLFSIFIYKVFEFFVIGVDIGFGVVVGVEVFVKIFVYIIIFVKIRG